MKELYVVTINEEFENLQKSRVKAHPSKTKSGKMTMVKEYSRVGEKKKPLQLGKQLIANHNEGVWAEEDSLLRKKIAKHKCDIEMISTSKIKGRKKIISNLRRRLKSLEKELRG